MKKKKWKKIAMVFIGTVVGIILAAGIFIRLPKFGRLPTGENLARIKQSPNYRDGSFQNVIEHPEKPEWIGVRTDDLDTGKGKKPVDDIPTEKTDLFSFGADEDVLVWFGHSSCYLQVDGKRILIDPVLSSYASPVFFATNAFSGTTTYTPDDIPEIDYLLISHDHWDHLDYPTVKKLRSKVKRVICGLGVGEHFRRWGYTSEQIIELDWGEMVTPDDGFHIYVRTAHHFSGRGLSRNKSQWVSFVVETPNSRLFYSGDGAYGPHFAEIGEEFDGFDLAIMENGQYDELWPESHMMPEDVMTAAMELGAKNMLPVHSGKFCICRHPWDEPLERIWELGKQTDVNVLTPMIGERVILNEEGDSSEEINDFITWWKDVR